jgi:hypothetical protein
VTSLFRETSFQVRTKGLCGIKTDSTIFAIMQKMGEVQLGAARKGITCLPNSANLRLLSEYLLWAVFSSLQ